MRAYLPGFEMVAPKNLDEALKLLSREQGQLRPFAGGTDLMVVFESGKLAPGKFMSIWNLDELKGIRETPEHLTLGALTTYSQIKANGVARAEFPMLCQAASETGAIAIQNRGTIGGNIANASPAADSPPALLVYEADVELVSSDGTRWVPYANFHTGYKKIVMRPDELIRSVRVPRATKEMKHYYRKVGTRKAQAISKVVFAGLLRQSGAVIEEARIALGSVAPTTIRCPLTENCLRGQRLESGLLSRAQKVLGREITPIDDIRSTSEFRNRVAGHLLEEFLTSCGTGLPS